MTSDPIRQLREATTDLDEATVHLFSHITEQERELADWVTAVARHAAAVEDVVRHLAGEPGVEP